MASLSISKVTNEVSRRADTPGTKINVAETKRVVAVLSEVVKEMAPDPKDRLVLLSKMFF